MAEPQRATFTKSRKWAVPTLLVAATVWGCRASDGERGLSSRSSDAIVPVSAEKEEGAAMTMNLTSAAFSEGQPIPRKYTGDGHDVSPPLSWSNVPEGTKEFVLICDDPDAPTREPWVHWVIYKIPANVTSLPEGVPKKENLEEPAGALQGKNSWPSGQTIGYRGPAPPPGHGTHHYHFKLYALDTELDVPPGLDKNLLLKAMEGHVIGRGELVGTYER